MFHGYLEMGGDEVVNRSRAYGYAVSAGCPLNWFQQPQSETLRDALGDPEYTYAQISEAPWFDPTRPETARFLGAYPTKIVGVPDSSRAIQVQEGIGNGGVVMSPRRAVKPIRVTAMLVGIGADALEAGFEWLNAAVDPAACGTHDSACGESDVCFFTADPPARPTVPGIGEVTVLRTNLAQAPRLTSGVIVPFISGSGTNFATDGPDGGSFYRFTPSSAAFLTSQDIMSFGTPAMGGQPGAATAPVLPNTTYTASLYVRTSVARTARLSAQSINGGGAGTSPTNPDGPSTSLPANTWTRLSVTFTTPASGMPAVRVDLDATSTEFSIGPGETIDASMLLLELGGAADSYFDGDTPDPDAYNQYAWNGTPSLSTSSYTVSSVTEVPATDAEYEEILSDYRRRMHGVMASSGPFVLQEFSRDGFFAYMVEFTLTAGKPFIYSMPRELTLPPVVPFTIQDVPRNEVPYPSAEVAGSAVVISRNLSTNPSVEVNATDWQAWQGVVSGTSPVPFVTSGRSTELSAGGSAASFRTRLLGNNGSTVVTNAVSYIGNTDIVQLGSYAANTRFSFSIWGAALIIAGASGSEIQELKGTVEWRNASDVTIGTVNLGQTTNPADFGGKVFSSTLQAAPAGATSVHIYIVATVRWSSSATPANNSDVRVYADTVAVTIP